MRAGDGGRLGVVDLAGGGVDDLTGVEEGTGAAGGTKKERE